MRIVISIQIIAIVGINFLIIWSFQQDNLQLTPFYLMAIQVAQVILLYRSLTRFHSDTISLIRRMINRDAQSGLSEKKWWQGDNQLGMALQEISTTMQQVKIEREAERLLMLQILEQIPVGVLLIDENDKVELANPSILAILDLPVIKNLKMIEESSIGLSKRILQMRAGQPTLMKVKIRQNIQFLSVSKRPFKLFDKLIRLITIHDIRSEIQQEEIESWQKLIRVLTHEIMNSIGPITSLSSSLTDHLTDIDQQREQLDEWKKTTRTGLEAIRKRGEGLVEFIESYRKITRIPDPQTHMVEVSDLLEETALLMREETVNSMVKVKIDLIDRFQLDVDEKLITQVLINLIRNACQAMASIERKELSLIAWLENNSAPKIAVRDTGIGIPEDIRDKLFVPFFTTHPDGSGIGLNLSRQIMNLHGGALDYSSKPGETTFILSF